MCPPFEEDVWYSVDVDQRAFDVIHPAAAMWNAIMAKVDSDILPCKKWRRVSKKKRGCQIQISRPAHLGRCLG